MHYPGRVGVKAQLNAEGKSDEFEIDIVAETLEGEVDAYEVKRNPKKISSARLQEKGEMMQRQQYRGKEVKMSGLSTDEM